MCKQYLNVSSVEKQYYDSKDEAFTESKNFVLENKNQCVKTYKHAGTQIQEFKESLKLIDCYELRMITYFDINESKVKQKLISKSK